MSSISMKLWINKMFKATRFLLIFTLIFGWIFSGWPPIWQNPRIPPEIQIAQATTRTIEQQINIIDQEYSTTSGTYAPTDNSLGIVEFDPSKYNGETLYFEAVIKGGGSANYGLFRSNSISLPASAKSYIVRIRLTNSGASPCMDTNEAQVQLYSITDSAEVATVENNDCFLPSEPAFVKAARLIIVQSDGTSITDTQTQVEVGNNENTPGTSYADLTNKKIYRYTSANWTPTPTVNFEASLQAISAVTNEAFTTAATTTGWAVPSTVTSLTVRVWGGGGGSGAGGDNAVGGTGGGGGFVQDTISVSAGQLYTIVVGGGGGLGANGSSGAFDGAGGGGGGYSAFTRESDSTILLIGGGGGGGGSGSEANDDGGDGGGGGTHTTSGVTGGRGTGGSSGGCGGVGGTSSGIGAGGACLASSTDGSPGVNTTGGAGASAGSDSTGGSAGTPGTGGAGGNGGGEDLPGGGGGGGGRYGAGGGEAGNDTDDKAAGGGGGGSGLCQDGTCDSEAAGSGTSPGNTTDRATYCLSTSGNGGAEAAKDTQGNVGVAGCVVISYTVIATAYAALYTTGGSEVSGSEISTTSSSWTRVITGSPITLSNATDYVVRVKTSSGTVSIANAKIVFDQTAGGGIDELEIYHQYINTFAIDVDSTYTLQDFHNEFNPSNWAGGTFNYYFEATMKTTGTANALAQLYNVSDSDAIDTSTNSEISTNSNTYARQISADLSGNSDWPSAAKTLDTQIKNSLTQTTWVSSSWLLIYVSGLASSAASTLTFSISGDNAIGLGSLSTSAVTWATDDENGSASETSAHTITASTNATNGYTITVNGTTLTSTGSPSDTISPIGASAVDVTTPGTSIGTEQFGIRLTASGGNGAVSSPYNGASNNYALDTASFPDIIASDPDGDDVATTYSVFYAANIATATEAHTDYASSLIYIATGNF